MAIKIGTLPSPHGEAAMDMTETKVTETTSEGEETVTKHESDAVPVHIPGPYDVLSVGVSFRMPVAQYTMLEFTVSRSRAFDPVKDDENEVFQQTKKWVEDKLNSVIAEQQAAGNTAS